MRMEILTFKDQLDVLFCRVERWFDLKPLKLSTKNERTSNRESSGVSDVWLIAEEKEEIGEREQWRDMSERKKTTTRVIIPPCNSNQHRLNRIF